ncbi:MAG: ABC transporter ATP-binding protein [Acidimicrobiia bacterium]|nr:ABC transporter ATP-binding protein [Acidimicrobiia bacterium]
MATGGLIEARSLVKRFGELTAVDGIDFEVQPAETFGFLGPNGAGKTSAMRMLAATSPVTEGYLRIFGQDPATDGPAIRARLGVVAQEDNLDTDLTVLDNLVIYGRYFGLPRRLIRERADRLLEFARLTDRRDEKVDPLSGGMKRRLAIARALINEPEIFLLDEPTTGLDPQARHLLWERLWSLKREGVTLVITTHYMDEAEQLCDRLVVMDDGRIVDEGSPRQLIERHCTREVVEARYRSVAEQALVVSRLEGTGVHIESLADRLLVYADDGDSVSSLLGAHDPVAPTSTLVRRATLEDVFLTLTGRTLEEI